MRAHSSVFKDYCVNRLQMRSKLLRSPLSALLLLSLVLLPSLSFAQPISIAPPTKVPSTAQKEEAHRSITWREVEPGYAIARAELGTSSYLISSELLLIRLDPQRFNLRLVRASDFKKHLLDVRRMTQLSSGLLGINTHFFDPKGEPLGLLVRDSRMEHRIQLGGSVLTGIFLLKDRQPEILHKNDYPDSSYSNQNVPELALQAGPRLIDAGKRVPINAQASATRRSGIAVTRSNEIILFATFLRFPGATLEQLQDFLLRPELDVVDALNLDGGGSSQLFVVSNDAIEGDMFISGGDLVPVGLVVRRRENEGS